MEENDDKEKFIKSLSTKADYELILTEDCLLLLEIQEKGVGKIAFWSTLFAITYLQLNKLSKLISLYFYDEEKNIEYQLKLKLDNILLFRDSLVKKMRPLKVKVESQKLIKGQQQLKRLSEKEIRENAFWLNILYFALGQDNIEIHGMLNMWKKMNINKEFANKLGKSIELFFRCH